MKQKYVYYIIAGLMVAVVAYPVIYATINSASTSNPFFCAPLIPCQKQPPGVSICNGSCTVVMADSTFSPGTINVSLGSTITWINRDGFSHTVSAFNTSAFSSSVIPPGKTFKLTITQSIRPGKYYYFCEVHPFMIGLLNVVQANTSA